MKALCKWEFIDAENKADRRFNFSAAVDDVVLMSVDKLPLTNDEHGCDYVTTCTQIEAFIQRLCELKNWDFEQIR